MILRSAKTLLVLTVALYYTVLVFNNTTDYDSNFQFIRHVLMMDSTFPNNSGMWRAINSPSIHTLFYITIIAWESLTMILCWWGGIQLVRNLKAPAATFHQTKNIAIAGLTLSLLMWFVAFLTIGGEWFLMWQSKTWNGQEAAFRMFTVVGIVLLFLVTKDEEQISPRA
jgi:predicted small integral membrane protein